MLPKTYRAMVERKLREAQKYHQEAKQKEHWTEMHYQWGRVCSYRWMLRKIDGK